VLPLTLNPKPRPLDRFTLPEDLVVPFLCGKYSVNEYADDMKRKGKKDADIDAACKLFSQVTFTITALYPKPCKLFSQV
jgi:hypothetical protein